MVIFLDCKTTQNLSGIEGKMHLQPLGPTLTKLEEMCIQRDITRLITHMLWQTGIFRSTACMVTYNLDIMCRHKIFTHIGVDY